MPEPKSSCLIERSANNLQSDRHSACSKSAWYGERRQARKVERLCVPQKSKIDRLFYISNGCHRLTHVRCSDRQSGRNQKIYILQSGHEATAEKSPKSLRLYVIARQNEISELQKPAHPRCIEGPATRHQIVVVIRRSLCVVDECGSGGGVLHIWDVDFPDLDAKIA
jgi:hypothetical protein